MNKFLGCFGTTVITIICIILSPAAYYFFGWVTGHLIKLVFGDTLINGMNYLFNTTRFTSDMLPTICGTLGVIGSFFKLTVTSSSKE